MKNLEFDAQLSILKKVLWYTCWASVAAIVIAYISTCFAQVKVQETGVVMRFGKVVRSHVEPGICIKFPWPADKLITVNTRSVQRMRVGFGADPRAVEEFERANAPLDQIKFGSFWIPYVLTGDKNILHIKVVVNYRISDASLYLFDVRNAEEILKLFAQNLILMSTASLCVDDVLTTGKLQLQSQVHQDLVAFTERVNIGLAVQSVEIKNVRPPNQTSSAFKNVVNAQEERTESIHQAEAYHNRIIPEANAEAEQIIQEALAYRNKKIDHAKGEAKRFELLVQEYSKNKMVTKERIRLETLEQILPNLRKIITEPGFKHDPVKLRILSQSSEQSN